MKQFLPLVLCLACLALHAEEHNESSNAIGGTFGPVVKLTQFGDGILTTIGARANATFLKMLLVGIGGHASVAQSNLKINGITEDVSHYYGTLGFGVRLFPGSTFHLTNYNNLGLGYLKLKHSGQSGFALSLEPELNFEVDIFSLFRIGAGLSYRLLYSKAVTVPFSSLLGIGGQIFLEFGWL